MSHNGEPESPLSGHEKPLLGSERPLCERCQRLDLSQERFLIPDRMRRERYSRFAEGLHGVRMGISSTPTHDRPGTPGFNTPSPRQRVTLGTFAAIRTSLGRCDFCSLVWQSVEDQLALSGRQATEISDKILVHATWEVDGRELVPSASGGQSFYRPVTRHIRLHWEPKALPDSFVVLRGDDLNTVGLDPAYLGRRIESKEDQRMHHGSHEPVLDDIDKMARTMRGWIKHCDSHHRNCRPDKLLTPLVANNRLRVLDVREAKIVPLTPEMEYIVLSYTWTRPNDLEPLLKQTCFDLWRNQGLRYITPNLAPNVRKAIDLVEHLGFRYLWTDSLCVVHDDTQDVQQNYSMIDRIFANASFTVCAVANEPDQIPFPRLEQHVVECGERLSLMIHHPVDTYVEHSSWAQGGWTCQDRLLSGRCLMFAGSRVWFQCQEESMSEDIFESSFQGCSADMVQSPAQIWSELRSQPSQFRAYIKCVELYTSRSLRREDHILRAFEGISNFLGAHMNTPFFGGLPRNFLDAAILWSSATSDTHLRVYQSGEHVAPSWSWAGWTGQATYRPPILSGAVEKIGDWLREHTWISWHLTDHQRIIGEIGTFAVGDVTERADYWRLSPRDMNYDRRAAYVEAPVRKTVKWPSLNRKTFFKKPPPPSTTGMPDPELGPPSYFLQFWTWSAFFRLGSPENARSVYQATGIHRYNIIDCNNDICGSIALPNFFVGDIEHQSAAGNLMPFEFIALSDAKYFRPQELAEWSFYIPKEREDSFWDLWYVLLLVHDPSSQVSRRVGLGKVFKDAFHQSFQPGMGWREFILA